MLYKLFVLIFSLTLTANSILCMEEDLHKLEYINTQKPIHNVSRAVIISENHILLAYNPINFSFYYLPGGHIDPGESSESAIIRELKEETGFYFKKNKFLGCLEYFFDCKYYGKGCHEHEYNFIFLMESDNLKYGVIPEQQEEHIYFKWIPLVDLMYLYLEPKPLAELINLWINSENDNFFASATQNISKVSSLNYQSNLER